MVSVMVLAPVSMLVTSGFTLISALVGASFAGAEVFGASFFAFGVGSVGFGADAAATGFAAGSTGFGAGAAGFSALAEAADAVTAADFWARG
jgi:hypothetical protein